jgi:hypothetical protein
MCPRRLQTIEEEIGTAEQMIDSGAAPNTIKAIVSDIEAQLKSLAGLLGIKL